MIKSWDPSERPYRFTGVRQTGRPGCAGWAYLRPVMVATEEEGRAMVAAPMAASVLQHDLDRARLDTLGRLIGWDHVVTRKRKFKKSGTLKTETIQGVDDPLMNRR